MAPVGTLCTTTDSQGVEYSYRVIAEGTVQIERCHTKATHITIPEQLDGLEVVSLGESSFANLFDIKSVHCGRCLKHIGDKAFFGCCHLADLTLNDGLEYVGSDAFGLCPSLPCLNIPASVRHLGQAAAGNQAGIFASRNTELRIAPDNAHLFIADDGCVYSREDRGLVLVDASGFGGETLSVLEGTVEISSRACASNISVQEVRLPHGLVSIGDEAFCGCSSLLRINLPNTLMQLGRCAFSITLLSELVIPASLVRFNPLSFHLGFSTPGLEANPYRSSLIRISVEAANPLLEMRGPVLCARTAAGLEVLLCSRAAEEVELGEDIARVHAHAFAGTSELGRMRIRERLCFAKEGLLPHNACKTLAIELDEPCDGFCEIELEVPSGQSGKDFIAATLGGSSIDISGLLSAYDACIACQGRGTVEGARQMASRLAQPIYMDDSTRALFEEELTSSLMSVCAHFGARSHWCGFDQLVDAGILDQDAISRMVEALTTLGDTPAAAYLLQLKVERYGRPVFDYGL